MLNGDSLLGYVEETGVFKIKNTRTGDVHYEYDLQLDNEIVLKII